MNAINEAIEVVANEVNDVNEVTEVNEEIMELIKAERKRLGLSYDSLGKKLGVSASYLYRLEKGKRKNPSSSVLKSLCEFFNIDPGKLLQMEPNLVDVDGQQVDIKVLTEVYDLVMKTDVDKMSDVMDLLVRIKDLQIKQ